MLAADDGLTLEGFHLHTSAGITEVRTLAVLGAGRQKAG